MNLRDRARRSLILVAALSMIFASGAFASNHESFVDDADFDVTIQTVEGERTLEVATTTGEAMTGVTLRNVGATSPFVTTVTDALYDHVGYQVTAMLSTLYLEGTGCETFIESNNLQLGFVTSSSSATGVLAEVLPQFVFEREIPAGLEVLGLDVRTILGTDDLLVQVDGLVEEVTGELEGNAPISVGQGPGGVFDNPAAHSCDGEDGNSIDGSTPSERVIHSGDETTFSLEDLATDVFATIANAEVAINDGLLEEAALIAALTEAVQEELDDTLILGLDPQVVVDAIVDELKEPLTDFAFHGDSALEMLGQSGVYAATPRLELLGTGGAPTGEYTGTMTITLLDVDNS